MNTTIFTCMLIVILQHYFTTILYREKSSGYYIQQAVAPVAFPSEGLHLSCEPTFVQVPTSMSRVPAQHGCMSFARGVSIAGDWKGNKLAGRNNRISDYPHEGKQACAINESECEPDEPSDTPASSV